MSLTGESSVELEDPLLAHDGDPGRYGASTNRRLFRAAQRAACCCARRGARGAPADVERLRLRGLHPHFNQVERVRADRGDARRDPAEVERDRCGLRRGRTGRRHRDSRPPIDPRGDGGSNGANHGTNRCELRPQDSAHADHFLLSRASTKAANYLTANFFGKGQSRPY